MAANRNPERGVSLLACESLRDIEAVTGISRRFVSHAKLINEAIPEDEFERLIESDNPSSVRQVELLAQRRTGKSTEYEQLSGLWRIAPHRMKRDLPDLS